MSRRRTLIAAVGLMMLAAWLAFLTADEPAARRAPAQNAPTTDHYRIEPSKEPRISPQQMIDLVRRRIKYVFVLYQENRSFDSYFGTFPEGEGLFTHPAASTPGFDQAIVNVDGSSGVIHPFRLGPQEFAADTDDVDHSHPLIVAKMHIEADAPRMDAFAATEERKYSGTGNPTLKAKQMGELTMAYEDCDTIPLLWRYAARFTLFDHIFQEMTGPSTLGNLSIIAAQTGQTQWALHPEQAYKDNGAADPGVPVMNDNDPFWGSQLDSTSPANKMPVNPRDFRRGVEYGTAINLTFASLPLTLLGERLSSASQTDQDPQHDLADVKDDIDFISARHRAPVEFGWYEEGHPAGFGMSVVGAMLLLLVYRFVA